MVFRLSSRAPAVLLAALSLPLAASLSAQEQEQSTVLQAATINIAAGTLEQVLNAYGQQTEMVLIFSPELTQGLNSEGLSGAYTTQQALQQLLKNTQINFTVNGETIVLADANAGVMMFDAVRVGGSALKEITHGQVKGYIVTKSPLTTRSNVSIAETSRSVQVINRDFIDDADIQSFDDALQYVSGATVKRRMGGVDKTYNLRGFQQADTYRNGKRELFDIRTNMNTVETVEVLKGPASVHFGVNSPGGIVNYTTKIPQADAYRSIKVRWDEHGQREVIGDFTGEVNESGTVLYRLIVAAEDSETFRDFSEQETSTVAPSFAFLLSDKTQLTAAYEFYHTDVPIDRGVPVGTLNGLFAIADVPIDRRVGEPGDVAVDDTHLFDLTLAHQFSDSWQGELSYSYQNSKGKWSDTQIDDVYLEEELDDAGSVLFAAGSITRDEAGYLDRDIETHQASAILHGDFDLAKVPHKITIGADYITSDFEGAWGGVDGQSPATLNIYNPVYGEIATKLTSNEDDTESTDSHGIFVSDTVYLGDSLIVNLASRYDYYDYEYAEEYEDPSDNYYEKEKDEAFTWNTGLLYKVVPAASLYLSYATSYQPNSANDLVGELKPQEGTQWEFGIKGLAMNDTLQYSLIFYDIAKSNIPNDFEIDDPDSADPDDTIDVVKLIGEQTSRGVELDATWQITDDFNLLASYAYIDAEISTHDEEPELVGSTLTATPEHSGAIFVSYALTPLVSGLSVMGGINYVDDVFGNQDNTYTVPGSTSYDLSLKYSLPLAEDDLLLVQAGIKNVTDEVIYIHHSRDSVAFGQPRTLYANLEYQF